MAYNTGNPIGSADPRDLYDNAQNLDEAVNSDSDEFEDRRGKRRLTIQGMVEAATTGNPAVGAAQEALGSAQHAEEQADRAETARDAAFVNADAYADTTAGLSATVDGEQFQVVESAEVVRYRNETGSAVEVARYPRAEVVGAVPQNQRVSRYTQRDQFLPFEVAGPFNADGGVPSGPTWSVANGELSVNADGLNAYKFWDRGDVWLGNDDFEAEVTFIYSDLDGQTTGPGICLYGDEGFIAFLYANSGTLGVFGASGGAAAPAGGDSSIAFSAGDVVTLRVKLKADGTGTLFATNESTGNSASHNVINITERGVVGVASRRNSAFTVSRFKFSLLDPRLEAIDDIESGVSSLGARVSLLEDSGAGAAQFDERTAGVAPPEGFTFVEHGLRIMRGLQTKRFVTDFSASSKIIPTSQDIYVDPATGDDGNTGGEGDPLATVASAITAMNLSGSPATIFVSSGEYSYEQVGSLPSVGQDFNLICLGESPAVLTNCSTETGWTADAAYPNLWRVDVSGPVAIWAFDNLNMDAYGEGIPLRVRPSLSEANDSAGSMFISGQTVYVRLADNREPDGDLRIIRDRAGWSVSGSAWCWINVHMLGASGPVFAASNREDADSCFSRCRLSYAYGSNVVGTTRNRGSIVFVDRSIASYSREFDGWNYHDSGDGPCHDVIEIDSIGHHNGLEAPNNNNGSTMHDGGRIIRVNGDYSYNSDRNVHDINPGTEVWMLGCECGDTQNASLDAFDNANFLFGVGSSDGVLAWLDSCVSRGGAVTDYGVYGTSSVLRLRACHESQFTVFAGDGQLEGY